LGEGVMVIPFPTIGGNGGGAWGGLSHPNIVIAPPKFCRLYVKIYDIYIFTNCTVLIRECSRTSVLIENLRETL